MKYCPTEGLRYPDSLTYCKTCGAQLVSADAADIFASPANLGFHTLCCPKPSCPTVVAPARTKFCALCGSELESISLEVWAAKYVRPELESLSVEFLLDPLGALRPAAEMGLPKEDVEGRLEQLMAEKVGVGVNEFMQWMQESGTLLREGAGTLEEAKRESLKQARDRGISHVCAVPVVERLAVKAEAERASTLALNETLPDASKDKKDKGAARGKEGDAVTAAGVGVALSQGKSSAETSRQAAQDRARAEARGTSTSGAGGEPGVLEPGWQVGGIFKKSEEKGTHKWGAQAQKATIVSAVIFILFASVLVVAYFMRGRPNKPVEVGVNVNSNQAGSPDSSVNTAQTSRRGDDFSPVNAAPSPESSLEVAQPSNVNSGDAQAQVATYVLLPNVDGVELWVDNVSQGGASRARPRNVNLSPGAHSLRATKANYEVWERTFNVTSGQRLTVYVAMEEMRGGIVSSGTPPSGASPAPSSPSPREAARAYAERSERLFNSGEVDEALAVVNEGLQTVGDDSSLNNLKRRLEKAKNLLGGRSTVAADALGPAQRRNIEPDARADRNAQLMRMPPPIYPADATSQGSTTVWVEVQIDERGGVSSARAVRGPSRFHSAAVNATRQAVFRPALRNGQSVGDRLVLPVMFNPR